jgi:hypothetical protein
MTNIGTMTAAVTADSSNFERAMKRASGSAKSFGRETERSADRGAAALQRMNPAILAAENRFLSARASARTFSRTIDGTAKSSRRNTAAFQQLGFQVGDFAVQVGSGTNALIAFSQQGSQLLGFFGAYGAVAGAALAIAAPLARAFFAQRDGASAAGPAIGDYASELERLSDFLILTAGGERALAKAMAERRLETFQAIKAEAERRKAATDRRRGIIQGVGAVMSGQTGAIGAIGRGTAGAREGIAEGLEAEAERYEKDIAKAEEAIKRLDERIARGLYSDREGIPGRPAGGGRGAGAGAANDNDGLTEIFEGLPDRVRETFGEVGTIIEEATAAHRRLVVDQWGGALEDGASALRVFAGENSRIYRSLFAASKAYSIGIATMDGVQAVQKAASAFPFPANLPGIAAETARAAANVARIKSTGFQRGGFTGAGLDHQEAGTVHRNEFVFDAGATARIGVSRLEEIRRGGGDAGGRPVVVNFNLPPGADVESFRQNRGMIAAGVARAVAAGARHQ